MTRGPPPRDMYQEASEIAGRRGTLKWFDPTDAGDCTFSIFGTDLVAIVKLRRSRRIWASPEEVCREYYAAIAGLKNAVLTGNVIRELWLCSYHGRWRFFQIVGWDLAEMDLYGRPVDGPCIAPPYAP